jgi:hypothetical protein
LSGGTAPGGWSSTLPDTKRQPEIAVETAEKGRRNSRFHYAKQRIQKIVDGAPPLTPEQLRDLALLLHPGADEQAQS